MAEPNLPFDKLLYFLTVYEGLSLWKFADFTRKGVQRIDFENSINAVWKECEQDTFGKRCKKVCVFFLGACLFIFTNKLISFAKWTPPLWTVGASVVVLWLARTHSISGLYGMYSDNCIAIVLWFIVSKTVVCLLGGGYNWIFMKMYKKFILGQMPTVEIISEHNFSVAQK